MPLFNPATASIGSVEVELILDLVSQLITAYRVDRIPIPVFNEDEYGSQKRYLQEIAEVRLLNTAAKTKNCMTEIRAALTEKGIYNKKHNPFVPLNNLRSMYDIIVDHCAINSIQNKHYPKFIKELDEEFRQYIKL